MKRLFYIVVCAASLAAGRQAARGADAASIAWQQDIEDRLRRATATGEENQAALASLLKAFTALQEENLKLRQDLADLKAAAANNEGLKHLSEQVQKVDERRVADTQLVQSKIAEVARAVANLPQMLPSPAPHRPTTPAAKSSPPKAASGGLEEGIEYVVESNDTLSGIVVKYRNQGIKVTQKTVMEANPGIKWDRLKVGQKVWIPAPK